MLNTRLLSNRKSTSGLRYPFGFFFNFKNVGISGERIFTALSNLGFNFTDLRRKPKKQLPTLSEHFSFSCLLPF